MNRNKIGILILSMMFWLSGKAEITDTISQPLPYVEEVIEASLEEESPNFEEDINSEEDTGEVVVLEESAEPWEVVTLQGKLKMRGLPLSPNVKIFMQHDSLISISLRAPFVGEAGRMDITPDSLIAVNKMSKSYTKLGLRDMGLGMENNISQTSPDVRNRMGIREIQELILGQFFLPGIDLASVELGEVVDVFANEDSPSQFNIVPKGEAEIEGVKYGFVVDEEFKPLMLMILPEAREDVEMDVLYTYKLQGYDLRIVYQDNSHAFEATLELKSPEWEGEAPKPIEIGKKYKEVRVWELFR